MSILHIFTVSWNSFFYFFLENTQVFYVLIYRVIKDMTSCIKQPPARRRRMVVEGIQQQQQQQRSWLRQITFVFYTLSGKKFQPLLPDSISPFDRPLTHKSFFNIVYFSLISLSHACLFDNNAIDRGVVVIVSLNHIGPLEFRRAFPTKVREQISEITNGISCFRMKECYLLRAPWWMKGLMVSRKIIISLYIYISNKSFIYQLILFYTY